jgi:hypothetical protein
VRIGKDTTLESFDNVPIDAYGKKILSNLGWYEGRGVGRNKVVVEPMNL